MTSFQCEHPTASWGIPEVRKFARQMVGEYVNAPRLLLSKLFGPAVNTIPT